MKMASHAVQLQLIDDDIAPAVWSGPHVSLRLVEAMQTLRLVPMPPGARGFGQAWPAYSYEWEDLLAQHEQGELERTQQLQNRSRPVPSWRDITRMEAAIHWPARFLGHAADLVIAVNAVALAYAVNRDTGWVARRRGGYADTWRERYDEGCIAIARGLRATRVPVF